MSATLDRPPAGRTGEGPDGAERRPPPPTTAQPRPIGNLYFGQWSGQFQIPSMIVAHDGRLLWTNGAADAVLAAGREFQAVNGMLVCADKSQSTELRAFLAGLGDEPDAWVYLREDTARHLLRAEAVRPAGLPPATALMIFPVDAEARYIWSDFHKVFGLTRAETAVVKRIMTGAAAEAIAEEMSIALDTVRTHVRRIYTKMGVNNREQLFSKVSPFRVR